MRSFQTIKQSAKLNDSLHIVRLRLHDLLKFATSLAIVFLSSHSLQSAQAAITPTGDVTPTYDGSDPWNLGDSDLKVGNSSTGSLIVDAGSTVQNANGYLGYASGVAGSATITGSGTLWSNDGGLLVGVFGDGTLNIENGATVVCEQATEIAPRSSSTGRINFNNGTLNTAELFASPSQLLGTGTINTRSLISDIDLVFDAGSGLQQQIILNSEPGQNVTINLDVTGPDVRCLGAGYLANGSLTIADGMVVSTEFGFFGYKTNAIGTGTVTGDGSTWLIEDNLLLGQYGAGTLEITNSATVISNNAILGQGYGSVGTITVSGAGSVWQNDTWVTLGHGIGTNCTGILNINSDALVSIEAGITLGYVTSGSGTINLSGGTLDLNGSSVFAKNKTSDINFTGGTLKNTGYIYLGHPFVQNGGTLAPGGSIGQTDIHGNYELSTGILEIELGGIGNPHDLLTVQGDIDISILGTTLDLQAIGLMQAGTYTIIEATGTITGQFETIAGLGLEPGLVDVQYGTHAVTITLSHDVVPEPATLSLLLVGICCATARRR